MRIGFMALFLSVIFFGLPAQAADGEITLKESESYGAYVADGEGRPLYLFVPDTQGTGEAEPKATCYDDCADAWPPFMGENMTAGEGIDAELIGTVERKDGEVQVTYNGWPLYSFVKDEGKDAPQGQDVHGFGGEWYLLTAEGGKVHEHGHGDAEKHDH